MLEDPHDDYDDIRYLLQGRLKQFIVIIVFTMPDDEMIRIISMRKANRREQEDYVQKRFG